jgi:hypothetical protein
MKWPLLTESAAVLLKLPLQLKHQFFKEGTTNLVTKLHQEESLLGANQSQTFPRQPKTSATNPISMPATFLPGPGVGWC